MTVVFYFKLMVRVSATTIVHAKDTSVITEFDCDSIVKIFTSEQH